MTGWFEGKVALVTGGASGIGRASALAFARHGAKVIIADIATGGGEETARMIKEAGGEALFVEADVTKAADIGALVDKAVATYGRLEYAHNNAGIEGMVASTADYTEEVWDRTIATNLKGVWLCMRYEIRQMLRQGGGVIVNTSSGAGLKGASDLPAYVSSKHGVVGLTRSAALEYAKAGIRINAVCPGIIRTSMFERLHLGDPQGEEKAVARIPLGRLGTPDDVANAVLWLCSDASSYISGHALVVDGALLAT